MKYLLIIIMLFPLMSTFAQIKDFSHFPKEVLEQLDKTGIDSFSILNSYESSYLSIIFQDSLKGFDFTGKRVGFISNGSMSNKKEYFDEVKNRLINKNTIIGGSSVYIFDSDQKIKSGGYDAAILYWSKFVIPIEKVVKKLKNNHSKQ